jgi:hypothetical protein
MRSSMLIETQSNVPENVLVSAVRFPGVSEFAKKGTTEYISVDQECELALLSRMAEVDSRASQLEDMFLSSSKNELVVTAMPLDKGTFPMEMIAAANGPIATKNHFTIVHMLMRKCLFRNAWYESTNGNQSRP